MLWLLTGVGIDQRQSFITARPKRIAAQFALQAGTSATATTVVADALATTYQPLASKRAAATFSPAIPGTIFHRNEIYNKGLAIIGALGPPSVLLTVTLDTKHEWHRLPLWMTIDGVFAVSKSWYLTIIAGVKGVSCSLQALLV